MSLILTDRVLQELPVCRCCNRSTRGAGGVVRQGAEPWVVYSVRWIPQKVAEHGASIRLSFPAAEGGELDAERAEVCLDVSLTPDREGLFLVDAWGDGIVAGEARDMTRAEVCRSAFMDHVRQLVPMIWERDENLDELRGLLPQPEVQITGSAQSQCKVPQGRSGAPNAANVAKGSEDTVDPTRLARQNWRRFLDVFGAGEGESFQIKREFVEGDTKETLWVLVTSVSGDKIRGRVGAEPAQLSGVSQLDEVEFCADEVLDWLVIDAGEYYAGGYSIPDEDPRARAVRVLADTNNLPTTLLGRFLTGLDLGEPLIGSDQSAFEEGSWTILLPNLDRSAEDFSEAEVREAFHADFGRVALRCSSVQIDLWHQGQQKEPLVVELGSDDPGGFTAGELLRKIHEAGLPFYSQVGVAHFTGLKFVYINERNLPVYALMARSSMDAERKSDE